MPYKVIEEDGEFCVYRHDDTGNPVGKTRGCHPSKGEAEAQMRALYAAENPPAKAYAVKTLAEDAQGITVGGYLLMWGDKSRKDLQGDFFTPDTKLCLDKYPNALTLFHHGLDNEDDVEFIGHRVKANTDDTGVWVEDWIDKSNKYWKLVKPLLEAERLYYSPGSAPHLVRRDDKTGQLKSYPVVEDTLTPIPAQFRLRPIERIKAAYKAANIQFADVDGNDGAGAGASGQSQMQAAADVETLLIELSEVLK